MPGYLCVGEYSSIPYLIQGLEIQVYCMEELCYGIKENAFLLDNTLMNDVLIGWIREQCGLDELADSLYPMVHRQGSLSMFVSAILQYVGLYDEDTIRQVEQTLRKGAGLSNLEKRKEQVDYLVKKKKYTAALRGYDSLLLRWEEFAGMGRELPGEEIRADILHNKGVAYCRLMLYGQAQECFLEAYRAGGNEEEYFCYLGAKRMELSENQYIAFAAGELEHYELTLELERRMQELRRDFATQPEKLMLRQRSEWREGSGKQRYYEESGLLCRSLKDAYRICVNE